MLAELTYKIEVLVGLIVDILVDLLFGNGASLGFFLFDPVDVLDERLHHLLDNHF